MDLRQSSRRALRSSSLADWMKLETFKELPELDYALRSTLAHRKWAMNYCQTVAWLAKSRKSDISMIFSRVRTVAKDLGVRLHSMQVTQECVGGKRKSPRAISQGTLACSAECQGGHLAQEVDRPCRARSICPLVWQSVGIQLLDRRLPLPEVS